ncbi:type IV secretion system protein TraC [Duganella sp. FT92W]|uniref:Type IV secretion system protein TraC n=1 Tax=Pseudoduganella rivuli TaxID=2666085 RepID=A0A7X2LPR6_9BURK|nr:type IV secretion system protein TraC [Pseudoduganella rivuli]MRV70575.1 type IV secretion system protein TraC [Pseudoduganella rivuli]
MFGFLQQLDSFSGLSAKVCDLVGIERNEESPADQFASWLPYLSYMDVERLFRLQDNRLGFALEVMPQSGADEAMVEVLASLYVNCPPSTGIQIQLFGSPHVYRQLKEYANLRAEDADQYENSLRLGRPVRNEGLYRKLARQRVGYLHRGAHNSLTPGFHLAVRDFRLMLSISIDGNPDDHARCQEVLALRQSVISTLNAASLPNKVCNADDLINWCAPFANPDRMSQTDTATMKYDKGREVRDQIVDFDTIQDAEPACLLLSKPGETDVLEARFFSVKSYPEDYRLWQMGALIGDLMQPALQYKAPFLISLGVFILDPETTKTVIDANHVRATQNAKSKMAEVMPDVERKKRDWKAAADASDKGGMLVSLYHRVAVFTKPSEAASACEAVKAIWRANGFTLNADVFMHRQSLISCLPMTLSRSFHSDLKKMKRVTRKSIANAIHMGPLIAEWRGTATPTLLFLGRRGQLTTIDLFDNELGNPNFALAGTTGSGKSTLLQEIAWSYRASMAQVWMLDMGRSFEKLCTKAKGTHIDFEPSSKIIINPFTKVIDLNEDMDMLVAATAKMCSRQHTLEEVQYKAISKMIAILWNKYGQDMTITALQRAFVTGSIPDLELKNDQRIRDLAIMLSPFAKGGQYERFFEGKNNIDLTNQLVVIESEHLKRKVDLQVVVNILLLYQITGQMYLTRNTRKLLIVDEIKQQLADTGRDDPTLALVLEEASRRARKYGGALGTATQDGDDYYGSVQMQAAFNCSDWLFLLRQKQESIESLASKKKLCIDETKKHLLASLRKEDGAYAEMYISSPIGEGVVRLVLDPATHLLFSNRLEDNKPLDELRARGLSIDEAISTLLTQRGVS